MSTILYILLAILLLGVLITVHEFGHFIAARIGGIDVMEFSIGFGPKLYSGTARGRKNSKLCKQLWYWFLFRFLYCTT